jgi:hypothetical protein
VKKKQISNKPYYFFIEDQVFGGLIFFITGKSEECKKIVIKKLGVQTPDCLDLMSIKYSGNMIELMDVECEASILVVWISEDIYNADLNDSKFVHTIEHESLHAISSILRAVGLNHNVENEEVYAYMQTWLVKQIFKGLEKRK